MYSLMIIYFNKIKLKLCEKKAGLEPETDLFQGTIMGTGKSIDFLYIHVFHPRGHLLKLFTKLFHNIN